jgi:hypothetical protein
VMVKTTRVKRAPVVKLVPRRLISSDETSFVRTSLSMLRTINLYICGLRPSS